MSFGRKMTWRKLPVILLLLLFMVLCSFYFQEQITSKLASYSDVSNESLIAQSPSTPIASDYIDHNMARVGQFARKVEGKSLQMQELIQELVEDVNQTSIDRKKNSKNLLFLQREVVAELKVFVKEHESESKKELKTLQEIVAKRIHDLQNPADCESARRLICQLAVNCGLGCLLHHYAICFFIALGTNRTLTLDLSKMNYVNMDDVFKPVAPTCPQVDTSNVIEWKGEKTNNPTPDDVRVVKVIIRGAFTPTTLFAPCTVPSGILERLSGCHDDPNVWWIGQIMKHLMRFKHRVSKMVDETKRAIGFLHPIAGVHVRRTDKLVKEAKYHGVDEYMRHVGEWFDRHDRMTNTMATRRLFVATDEPHVIEEFKKYKNYTIIHDPHAANRTIRFRFTNSGLIDIINDIMLLSQCDFFVGTYSSNVGRIVYELMQADADRTYDAVSVDSMYNFLGGHSQVFEAIQEHDPLDGEIAMSVGDRITSPGYHDFSWASRIGRNERTRKKGSFPAHKVKKILIPAEYPGIL